MTTWGISLTSVIKCINATESIKSNAPFPTCRAHTHTHSRPKPITTKTDNETNKQIQLDSKYKFNELFTVATTVWRRTNNKSRADHLKVENKLCKML